MRVICLLPLALCAIAQSVSADIPKAPKWPDSIAMAGWHAEAVAVAVKEFQKHQGGVGRDGRPGYGDLRHYSVHISRSDPGYIPLRYAREECICVTFAPELSARDRRANVLGGGTDYGIAVSYDIARRGLKIIKTSWPNR